jgi:hypothetical protein
MMKSRGDFLCLHEPFCTLYDTGAATVPDGRGSALRITDEAALIDAILKLASRGPVFLKETTDHRYEEVLRSALLREGVSSVILFRPPDKTIRSHLALDPSAVPDAIGYKHLC